MIERRRALVRSALLAQERAEYWYQQSVSVMPHAPVIATIHQESAQWWYEQAAQYVDTITWIDSGTRV